MTNHPHHLLLLLLGTFTSASIAATALSAHQLWLVLLSLPLTFAYLCFLCEELWFLYTHHSEDKDDE